MENDIRIKDLTNTALEMASDDYIGIDGLTNGTRKIPFSGIMDSLDPRFATTNKTPRGAIAEIKQIVDSHGNAISSIKNMISDEYDDSADYDVGDYCIYDNVRYCCNTEISGGETWNSAHWDVAKVDDDITEIKSSLSDFGTWEEVALGTPTSGTIITGTSLIKNSALHLAILSIQWNGMSANATVALNVDILGTLDKPIYGWNSYNNRQVNGLLRASDNKLEILEAQALARLYAVFPIES